jgi:DNA repair exonuclease SbcCD ATPase subunit
MTAVTDLETINELAKLEQVVKDCLTTARGNLAEGKQQQERLMGLRADQYEVQRLLRESQRHLDEAGKLQEAAQGFFDAMSEKERSVAALSQSVTAAADRLGGREHLDALREEHAEIRNAHSALKRTFTDLQSKLEQVVQAQESVERGITVTKGHADTALRAAREAQVSEESGSQASAASIEALNEVLRVREQTLRELEGFGGLVALEQMRDDVQFLQGAVARQDAGLIELAARVESSWIGRALFRRR